MKNQEQKAFQKDLIISLVLHLVFIGVFIYGLPSIFKKVQEEPDVITFEMLPVSDITNVRDQGVKTPEPKEIKKSQKIEKSASSPKENLEQKEETPKQEEPKPVEKKPETPKEEKTTPSKEAEIVPEKKKEEEVQKKEEPKPVEKKPETKKEEDKKKPAPIKKEVKQPQPKKEETTKKAPKKQEDVIDSLLANLEKESEGTERRSPNRTPPSPPNEGKFAKGNNADEESPLSITEEMLIKQQIIKHWDKPAGIDGIEVIFHVKLDIEGNVTIIQVSGLTGDKQLQVLVEETGRRAVKKASPIKNLRPERYNVWKEFKLRFDPSSMM
ncbi:MAG: cell envelope integrity protein TolA [Rickettsiales bacterium]|nr:cell envelope integrity protein TolA [Rickettsiales bacterium]